VSRTTREQDVVYTRQMSARIVTQDRTRAEHVVEQALYLYPRDGTAPWVLTESEGRYLALGAERGVTRRQGFDRTVAILRNRASRAAFDERFAARPLMDNATIYIRGHDRAELGATRSVNVDITLFLLARWLMRAATPYRQAP